MGSRMCACNHCVNNPNSAQQHLQCYRRTASGCFGCNKLVFALLLLLLMLQLQVEAVVDAPKTLTLDTRDLTFHKVALLSGSTAPAAAAVSEEKGSAEQSLQYVLAEKHPVSACLPTNTATGSFSLQNQHPLLSHLLLG